MSRFFRFVFCSLLALPAARLKAENESESCESRSLRETKLIRQMAQQDDAVASEAFDAVWGEYAEPLEQQLLVLLKERNMRTSHTMRLLPRIKQQAEKEFRDPKFRTNVVGLGGFAGYLKLIAINKISMLQRRSSFYQNGLLLKMENPSPSDPKVARIVIGEALFDAPLLEAERAFLDFAMFRGYNPTQIADFLDYREARVVEIFNSGLAKLRAYLKERGYNLNTLYHALQQLVSAKVGAGLIWSGNKPLVLKKKRIRPSRAKPLAPKIAAVLEDREKVRRIRKRVLEAYQEAELTPRMKLVLKRKLFEGASVSEVAAELNASAENTRQSLYAAIDIVVAYVNLKYLNRPLLLRMDFSRVWPRLTPEDFGEEPKSDESTMVDEIIQAIKDADLLPRMRKTVILRLFYRWQNQDVVDRFGLKVTAASASFTVSLQKMATLLAPKGISFEDLKNGSFVLSRDQVKSLLRYGKGPAGQLEPLIFRAKIEEAIRKAGLSPRERLIAQKYLIEGLEADEAKAQLALPGPALSRSYADLREKISNYLKDFEISPEDVKNIDFSLPESEWNPMRFAIDRADLRKHLSSPEQKFDVIFEDSRISKRTEIMLRLRIVHRWGFQNIAEVLNMSADRVKWYIQMEVDRHSVDLANAGFVVSEIRSEAGCFPYKQGWTSPFVIAPYLKNLGFADTSGLNSETLWEKVSSAANGYGLSEDSIYLLEQRIRFNRSSEDLATELGALPSSISAKVSKSLTMLYPKLEKQKISREHVVKFLSRDEMAHDDEAAEGQELLGSDPVENAEQNSGGDASALEADAVD